MHVHEAFQLLHQQFQTWLCGQKVAGYLVIVLVWGMRNMWLNSGKGLSRTIHKARKYQKKISDTEKCIYLLCILGLWLWLWTSRWLYWISIFGPHFTGIKQVWHKHTYRVILCGCLLVPCLWNCKYNIRLKNNYINNSITYNLWRKNTYV